MRRLSGIVVYYIEGVGLVTLSEIGTYPIGTIQCINKPESYNPDGLLMNSFADHAYDEKCDIDFIGIPYLEINSLYPADFRNREAFLELKT